MMGDPRFFPLDLVLIVLSIFLALNYSLIAGGFEWFLLLALSPNAHRN